MKRFLLIFLREGAADDAVRQRVIVSPSYPYDRIPVTRGMSCKSLMLDKSVSSFALGSLSIFVICRPLVRRRASICYVRRSFFCTDARLSHQVVCLSVFPADHRFLGSSVGPLTCGGHPSPARKELGRRQEVGNCRFFLTGRPFDTPAYLSRQAHSKIALPSDTVWPGNRQTVEWSSTPACPEVGMAC